MRSKENADTSKQKVSTPVFVIGILVATLVVVIGAIYIGKSDSGEIDVTSAINNSNQINREANGDSSADIGTVPDTFRNLPNGGLVPDGNVPPVPQVPVEVSTTTEDLENSENASTTTDGDTTDTEAPESSAEASTEEAPASSESAEPISQ